MKNLIKNRFLVSASSFLLLLIAVIILIVIPSISEIRLIKNQVNEERERLEKLYTKGQIRRYVQKNFENIKNDAEFLDNVILKENQELEYITSIESLAEKNNISITMTTGEPQKKSEQSFSELEFIFSVSGSWKNIIKWIEDVELLPYYTNMSEISITTNNQQEQNNRRVANATIKATTYWLISE